ncbi:MAG TPA: glycogen synthase GlgA [Stellaceae bacterium]|nr:glycogen synthase GlgA [Stellaceae bacterium]
MRVLQVAAELFPMIRTGGLGDVLAALPPALASLDTDIRYLLPGYPALLAALGETRRVATIAARFGLPGGVLRLGLAPRSGLPLYVLDWPALYDRLGNLYLGPDGLDWPDNHLRFGALGWAAAELAAGRLDPDWRAEICHAHDWHAGLAPVFLRAGGDPAEARPASVFTIHNLAFQGLFPLSAADELGLSPSFMTPAGAEFWGQLSFMKAGLVFADRVTTVSPGYAAEIATPEFGCGLEGVIADRGGAVVGILNGVDYERWDPSQDSVLPARFDAEALDGKALDAAALRREFGLAEVDPDAPDRLLLGVVSRLTAQKGLDLVLEALPEVTALGCQLVLLGAGDAPLEQAFRDASLAQPEAIGVRIGYDDALAKRIIGGVDALLVPSRFEPCGLTQLYALRYGSPPLVRRTGGLADTVVDHAPATAAAGTATGFLFDEATRAAFLDALRRMRRLFDDRVAWRGLQRAGMAQRFGWSAAAEAYRSLYASL